MGRSGRWPCRRLRSIQGRGLADAAEDGLGHGGLRGFFRCMLSLASAGKVERALWLMLVVSAALTVMQVACGFASHSLSLLGDSALMAVDVVCYGVGIYAERRKAVSTNAEAEAKKADRFAAFFSTVMLALATCWVLFDVVDRLIDHSGEDDEARHELPVSVDSRVMIVFTAVNLVADVAVVFLCWRCGLGAVLGLEDGGGAEDENMNLFGALAHLGADVVRGLAVLVAGSLAVADLVDGAKADAYCSLFVCAFVLAAAVSLLQVLLKKANPLAYANLQPQSFSPTLEDMEVPGLGCQDDDAPPSGGQPHAVALSVYGAALRATCENLQPQSFGPTLDMQVPGLGCQDDDAPPSGGQPHAVAPSVYGVALRAAASPSPAAARADGERPSPPIEGWQTESDAFVAGAAACNSKS